MPGIELAAGRALPAGIALAAIALLRSRHAFALRGHWLALTGMAVTIAGLYGITFVYAIRLPVAIGSLLANASPLFAVALAAIFLQERVSLLQALGVVLGFCGVAVMALPQFRAAPADFWAMMAMLAGAFMLAINTVLMKMAQSVDPIVANAVQMLIAGVLLLGVSAAAGERMMWPGQPVTAGAVLYTSLAATALGYVLWMRAVTLSTVTRVSVLLFLVPVFGLLWGWVFLHETITAAEAVGSLLAIIGIALASL